MGVNHNILITNIPIGSLAYGVLFALVYDSNAMFGLGLMADSVACIGRKCYGLTLMLGCISIMGLASSLLLFLRTRPAYDQFEQHTFFFLSFTSISFVDIEGSMRILR